MAIQNIKRWHWVMLSLLAGLVFGYTQQLPTENWQKAFGDTLSQRQFEEGLTRVQSGRYWFRNIVVYPERVEVGDQRVPVHIVAGDYFGGRLEVQDGQRVAVWHRRCYIAEEPYYPLAGGAGLKSADTVLAYLKSLPEVSYTYAWWRDPTWGIAIWTAGSVLVIGLIWPTVINLLVFGSFFRPVEEKGLDLSRVSSASPPRPGAGDTDLEAVEQMGAPLEASLAADAIAPAPQQAPAGPARVQPLTATASDTPIAEQARDEKAFKKDENDFYPTELYRPSHKSE